MNTMNRTMGVTKEFVGTELEEAYAKVMGWRVRNLGVNDCGKDLATDIPVMPFVQAKSSIPLAMKFLKESIRVHEFIPLVLGDPGKPDEVLDYLKRFGTWIGYEIPGREKLCKEVQQLRRILTGT
jgi:hypothetical protein